MFGHRGVGQEVRHLRISGGFDGGFSDWRTLSARNFSERSWPSSKRLKFLRCLRALQRLPTCSCYVVMPSSRTSTSSPKFFLQCGQVRLKITMWWVLNQRSFNLVSGPSDKLIGWRAYQWLSPSRKNPRPAQRHHPRRRLLDLQCLTGWAPLHPQRRGLSHRSRPFELAPEGPVHDPSKEARSLARLLHLPQPDNVDGSQVGARLADFAPHWRSLLGNCRATGIVEDGVGIAFQQRPQLTHQSISFRTRNSRQDLQQAVDRASHQREVPGFLQSVVSGTQEDRRSATCNPPVHSQPPHGSSTLQDGDARVRPISHQKSGVDGIDRHVPMHQAVRKYLRFVVNKKVYQFTCHPFGLATSPREFTKLLRSVVSLSRQQGVKLHVYLDHWLIRADTP